MLETFTINGVDYTAYLSLADAMNRMAVKPDCADSLVKWTAFSDEEKEKRLVYVSDIIDRETYRGQLTDPNQARSFPRTGLKDKEGRDVPSDEIPESVKRACIILLCDFVRTDGVKPKEQNPAIKSVGAGSARVEFWYPNSLEKPHRLGTDVFDLLRPFLQGGSVFAKTRFFGGGELQTPKNDFELSEGLV